MRATAAASATRDSAPALRLVSARLRSARDPLDSLVMNVWTETLGRRPPGIDESFISLGATLRVVARMREGVREECGIAERLDWITGAETIDELTAALIERHTPPACQVYPASRPEAPTLFLLHGDVNGRGFYVSRLARLLSDTVAVCALAPHGPDDPACQAGIEAMAAEFLATIRRMQPVGPYWLGGYCNGSLVAYELARQLEAQGERVARLVMLDPSLRNYRVWFLRGPVTALARALGIGPARQQHAIRALRDLSVRAETAVRETAASVGRLWRRSWEERLAVVGRNARRYTRRITAPARPSASEPRARPAIPPAARARNAERHRRLDAYVLACRGYIPGRYQGRVDTVWADQRMRDRGFEARHAWPRVVRRLTVTVVPGTHQTCVATHVEAVATAMRAALRD